MVRIITNRVQVFSKENPNTRPDVITQKIHRKPPQVKEEGLGGRASPQPTSDAQGRQPNASLP